MADSAYLTDDRIRELLKGLPVPADVVERMAIAHKNAMAERDTAREHAQALAKQSRALCSAHEADDPILLADAVAEAHVVLQEAEQAGVTGSSSAAAPRTRVRHRHPFGTTTDIFGGAYCPS